MSFEKSIIEFSALVNKALENVFKDVVIEVGETVITLSPVLTGRFKGNWQLTANTPSNYSLNNYDPDGSSTIAKLINGSESLTTSQVAYIVNNLTYGYEIETVGWPSGKEPYMPVRTTEGRFHEIVKEAVRKHSV